MKEEILNEEALWQVMKDSELLLKHLDDSVSSFFNKCGLKPMVSRRTQVEADASLLGIWLVKMTLHYLPAGKLMSIKDIQQLIRSERLQQHDILMAAIKNLVDTGRISLDGQTVTIQ